MSKRQMHLGVFVLGTGNHSAGWRYDGAFTTSCSLPVMTSIARIAERGKFDLFFISDAVVMDPGDHPSFVNRFEPLTLVAALSTVTTHVGLGATVSTSFGEPYHVARAFASLDHLSNGRAGWNVVTSTHDKAKIRTLDHKGRFYSVKGPLNIERSPQGHPVIIQAGGLVPGQELSARSADLVFSVVNGDRASAKAAYDSLKSRVIKHGRRPEHVPILPGV